MPASFTGCSAPLLQALLRWGWSGRSVTRAPLPRAVPCPLPLPRRLFHLSPLVGAPCGGSAGTRVSVCPCAVLARVLVIGTRCGSRPVHVLFREELSFCIFSLGIFSVSFQL